MTPSSIAKPAAVVALISLLAVALSGATAEQPVRNEYSEQLDHVNRDGIENSRVVVAASEGRYMAWPANNGVWSWDGGKEILVGHLNGPWDANGGFHKIGNPMLTNLARSKDGGRTWTSEDPDGFVGDGRKPVPCPGNINFGHPDFALRGSSTGYEGVGNENPQGAFYVSYDRGKSWEGPYEFNGLMDDPELRGMENTTRSSILVTGPKSCLVIGSARKNGKFPNNRLDKPFVAKTTDGGRTFRFVSWVVPTSDPYRAVMASTVRATDGSLVVALRRRNPREGQQPCWIDAYASTDNGKTWSFRSRVGETGLFNGNPPAVLKLRDGRLVATYGNRTSRRILARISSDNGLTWSEPRIIRDGSVNYDFGYTVLAQNTDDQVVSVYYFHTPERPQCYIEATRWRP